MKYEFKQSLNMIDEQNIPSYDLDTDYKVNIELISHDNIYDFEKIHRHNYYEIFFFEKGGGYQQIDFKKIPINDFSCYVVKPGQVHLLDRGPEADGMVIQFTEMMILPDVFSSSLSILMRHLGSEVLFEQNKNITQQFLKN